LFSENQIQESFKDNIKVSLLVSLLVIVEFSTLLSKL